MDESTRVNAILAKLAGLDVMDYKSRWNHVPFEEGKQAVEVDGGIYLRESKNAATILFNPHEDLNHLAMCLGELPWHKQNLWASRAKNICSAKYAAGKIKQPLNWYMLPTATLATILADIVEGE